MALVVVVNVRKNRLTQRGAVNGASRTYPGHEAWATLQRANFMNQYEDGWLSIHGDKVLVGRALTAVWMPGRPDIQKVIVDMLQPRDIYVADHFQLKVGGPSIGDNVGNAIYANPVMESFTMAQSGISMA